MIADIAKQQKYVISTIKRRALESEHGLALPAINQFLGFHLDRLSHLSAPIKGEGQDFTVLDRLLRDTVLA